MPGIPSAGATVYLKFTTRAFATGIPTTLSGSPVVSIYKDASTTQSTTGVTLTADFDSVTGLNHVSINTAADTSFYANGSTYYAVITTGTVGGISVVGETVETFSLTAATYVTYGTAASGASSSIQLDSNASSVNNYYTGMIVLITGGTGAGQARRIASYTAVGKSANVVPDFGTTPDSTSTYTIIPGGTSDVYSWFGAMVQTPNQAGVPLVDLKYVLGTISPATAGSVSPDWGHVTSPTSTVALSGTTVGTVTTYTGNTPQTGDSYARINTAIPNIAAGSAGGLFIAGTNAATTITTGLTTHLIGTVDTVTTLTNLPAITSNWLTAAGIAASALNGKGDWLTAAGTLAHVTLVDTVTTYTGNTPQTGDSFARIGATGSGLTSLAPSATALSTANWTNGRAGNLDILTTSNLVAALWDSTISGHTTTGTFGGALNAAGSAGDPWTTTLPGAYSAGTAGHIIGTAIPDIAAGAAGGIFIAGANAATSVATAFTATLAGSLTGSVASVTNGVTIGGYASGQDPATLILDATQASHVTDGTVGLSIAIGGGKAPIVAIDAFEFFMALSSDHFSAAVGLGGTVSATRSTDGGAFTACDNAVTEIGDGVYAIDLSIADLTFTSSLTLQFAAAGCDSTFFTIIQ